MEFSEGTDNINPKTLFVNHHNPGGCDGLLRVLVVVTAVVLTLCMAQALRGLNFVGSDEENLYLPAALQMPYVTYPSQLCHSFAIHNAFLVHGKEAAIWHFSLWQRWLQDYTSLRPLLLTVITAWALCAVLIFEITAFYWGPWPGLICFGAFVTSFWPYVYVLLVKHQLIGLFYFLAAVFCLRISHIIKGAAHLGLYALSGIFMGMSLYGSTVSMLYIPFYLAALFRPSFKSKGFLSAVLGSCTAVYYFNYPHLIGNVQEFFQYIQISRSVNHFSFHQNVFRGWMDHPAQTFGGLRWALLYLQLAMPVLFPCYWASLFILLFRRRHTNRRWSVPGMAALSSLPLGLALAGRVAQYGGNYFPCLIGVILFLGYAVSRFLEISPKKVSTLVMLLFSLHTAVNACILFSDIWPGRMASVYLTRQLRQLPPDKIYMHAHNPLNRYLVGKIDPQLLSGLNIHMIGNINEAKDGYIILAPVVGSSIYQAMTQRFSDFDEDPYLNELFRKNVLEKYALASFKTMASSRIWRQEEETLSYRDLMLGQFSDEYARKSRLWILDAQKLARDRSLNTPCPEYIQMVDQGIRSIGSKSNVYRYKGLMIKYDHAVVLPSMDFRLYKIGDPQDGLVLYVFKNTPVGWAMAWVPAAPNGSSGPISAAELPHDETGAVKTFKFDPPLALTPGIYHFVLYRSGAQSDENFYRVYVDEDERASYIRPLSFGPGL